MHWHLFAASLSLPPLSLTALHALRPSGRYFLPTVGLARSLATSLGRSCWCCCIPLPAWSIGCSLTHRPGHRNDLLVGRREELEQLELLASSVQRAFRPAPLLAERPRLPAQRRHSNIWRTFADSSDSLRAPYGARHRRQWSLSPGI